jgi:copper chaperone CopZ
MIVRKVSYFRQSSRATLQPTLNRMEVKMSEHENCHVDPVEKTLDRQSIESAVAAYLLVGGMGCANCAMRVRNGLISLEGVFAADVELEQGVAAAAYDPERVTTDDLLQAVAQAGNDGRHHYVAHLIKQVPASQALRW